MDQSFSKTTFKKIRSRRWIAIAIIVLAIGAGATIFAIRYTDRQLRASLSSRAETIAGGVHDDVLKRLTGTPADIGTDDYDDIKASMMRIRAANPDARFVYLMGARQGALFFYGDSEPADSEDYSAPGDIYADASELKIKNALAGVVFTEGPYKDIWGTWISGYAPVRDTDGTILATIGIDIHATAWKELIVYAAALPALITLFLLTILFLYYRSRNREEQFVDQLEAEEVRLKSLYEITTHAGEKLADQFRAALALGSKTLGTKIAVLSHIQDGKFTVEYCVVPPNTLHEGDVFALAETYCDITVKKDDVLSIDQMKTDVHKGHACYKKFNLEAYIGVPVKVFGILHGTLAFMAPDPHHPNFSGGDRDFVRLMGKWMSVTLEREQVEKMKSEFVSVASHQLRTPLTGIKWFAELMLKGKAGELAPKQKDFLTDIYDSNERMIKLVENLLNVSRIEAGDKFTIAKEPIDVVPILASLQTDLVGLAHTHKVAIIRAAAFPASLVLAADPEKIRQVFGNLLSNAVKYSHEAGTVTIGVSIDEKTATFSIADTGLGIPAAQQGRVFEKFFRADNVQTAETDGTGLGLYIVKAIVEGHEGKLRFESKENVGTTFFVTLPLK